MTQRQIAGASFGRWAAILAVLLLAFWLRLTIFSRTELGLDGLLSVGIAHLDWSGVLSFSLRDVHPPLYYLLLAIWLHVAGPSLPAARWPSVAAGLLALAIFYRLLARRGNGQIGLAGLALLATAPAATFLAATVRDFTPGLLLSLGTWWLLDQHRSKVVVKSIAQSSAGATHASPLRRIPGCLRKVSATCAGSARRAVRDRQRIALAIATAAGLLTWYFHVPVWLLQLPVAARHRRDAIGPLLLGAGLALPWYLAFGVRLLAQTGGFGASGAAPDDVAFVTFLQAAALALVGELPWPGATTWPLAVWLLAVVGGCSAMHARKASGLAWLVAAGVAGGLVGAWLLFRFWVGGDFLTRFFLLPGFFGSVAVAWSIGATRHHAVRLGVLGLVILSGLGFYAGFVRLQATDQPVTRLQHWLTPRLDRRDLVIFDDLADLGYFWLTDRSGAALTAFHTSGAAFLRETDLNPIAQESTAAVANGGTIWRVQSSGPSNADAARVDTALAERWQAGLRQEVAGVVVEHYDRPARWQPAMVSFGNLVMLQAVSIPSRVAGGAAGPDTAPVQVAVGFRWSAEAAIGEDYTVFVHALDASGRRVGQHDGPPGMGLRPTTTWQAGTDLLDLHGVEMAPGTPPGRYQVIVGLYRGQTRLHLPDGTDSYLAGEFELTANGDESG